MLFEDHLNKVIKEQKTKSVFCENPMCNHPDVTHYVAMSCQVRKCPCQLLRLANGVTSRAYDQAYVDEINKFKL